MLGGLALAAVGALVWVVGRLLPGFVPGRLPGDVVVERPGLSVFVPFTTMLVLSVLATLVLWLLTAMRR